MSVTSVIPSIVLMAVYLVAAQIIARYVGFYRKLIDETQSSAKNRFDSLDGLRGFLSLAVFFHHGVIFYFDFENQRWVDPPSHYYAVLGPVAVAFFFMMTGLLFWNKAIQSKGRVAPLRLYWNRAKRIGPLYLFSVACCLVLIMWTRDLQWENEPARTGEFILKLACLGLFQLPVINGYAVGHMNAGVLWTLVFEWRFYLALPVLAIFFPPRWFILLSVGALVAGWYFPYDIRLTFLAGMLTAYLVKNETIRNVCCKRWIVPLVLIPLAFVPSPRDLLLAQSYAFLLLPAFLAMACGNDLWGLLNTRGAKYLGTISYSIYLMHGIFLTFGLRLVNKFVPITSMGPYEYWAIVCMIGFFTIIACGFTYRWIEHPFLASKPRTDSAAAKIASPVPA